MTKNYIGYRPFEYQKDIHNFIGEIGPYAGYIIVVKAKRQVGKSFLIEQELLRHSINYARSVSICISITFANCKKIFNELVTGIKDSGVVKKIDSQAMEITLINDSQIIFKSSQSREALRGYTIKNGGILCIDEASYLSDEIFGIISPWCDVNSANILMVSTPRMKQGFFYEYYNEGLDPSSTRVKSFDINNYDTSFLLSNEKLELYRKLMPASQFTSEYLGCFIDDMGGVFKVSNDIWWQSDQNYNELFIGIDFGAGTENDYTVISCFNAEGKQIFMEYVNKLTPNEQVDWIANFINCLDINKIKTLKAETNSIGNIYISMLQQKIRNVNIEGFTTTNESKRDIIEYMIARINDSNLKLIKNQEQYREFSMYEMEITSTGKITYNGHMAHDDMVMASGIALSGLRDYEINANYALSFGHKNIKSKYHYAHYH